MDLEIETALHVLGKFFAFRLTCFNGLREILNNAVKVGKILDEPNAY